MKLLTWSELLDLADDLAPVTRVRGKEPRRLPEDHIVAHLAPTSYLRQLRNAIAEQNRHDRRRWARCVAEVLEVAGDAEESGNRPLALYLALEVLPLREAVHAVCDRELAPPMAPDRKVYDPRSVRVTWNGVELQGFVDTPFMEIAGEDLDVLVGDWGLVRTPGEDDATLRHRVRAYMSTRDASRDLPAGHVRLTLDRSPETDALIAELRAGRAPVSIERRGPDGGSSIRAVGTDGRPMIVTQIRNNANGTVDADFAPLRLVRDPSLDAPVPEGVTRRAWTFETEWSER